VCVERKSVHRALAHIARVGFPVQCMVCPCSAMYMCDIEHTRLVCAATECIFLNLHVHVLHHVLCAVP
jgi:hypothetical protein